MDRKRIILDLESQIKDSDVLKDDEYDASWIRHVGILLTKKEAKKIIELLRKTGDKRNG